ncbi:hypothetical protein B0H14DRAFT_3895042 [Mycena olivaceomarginata]|nr:hypothetical protein B0H14DRAFT_3895042 [Mycena olivaceomarginata]
MRTRRGGLTPTPPSNRFVFVFFHQDSYAGSQGSVRLVRFVNSIVMADNRHAPGHGGSCLTNILHLGGLCLPPIPPHGRTIGGDQGSALVSRTLKTSLEQQITETRMRLLRLEREEMHAAHHMERCKFPLAPV